MNKIVSFIINKILIGISWLLLLISILLHYGSQKSMGISRDLTFRNTILMNTIFTPKLLVIYKIIMIIVIVVCGILLYLNSKKSRFKYCTAIIINVIIIVLVNIISISMIGALDKVSMLAFPWIVLSCLILSVAYSIKLVYVLATEK